MVKTAGILAGVGTAIAVVAIGAAPASHADEQSYIDYINTHGGSMAPRDWLITDGHLACDRLHAGRSIEAIRAEAAPAAWLPPVWIEAAQHELCPDTLR